MHESVADRMAYEDVVLIERTMLKGDDALCWA